MRSILNNHLVILQVIELDKPFFDRHISLEEIRQRSRETADRVKELILKKLKYQMESMTKTAALLANRLISSGWLFTHGCQVSRLINRI